MIGKPTTGQDAALQAVSIRSETPSMCICPPRSRSSGRNESLRGFLVASAVIAFLVISGVAPGSMLWIALVAAIVVILAKLVLIFCTKLTV